MAGMSALRITISTAVKNRKFLFLGKEYTRDADLEKRTEETRDWKDHEAVDTRVSGRW